MTNAIPARAASRSFALAATLLLAPARADTLTLSQADLTIAHESTSAGGVTSGRIIPLHDINGDGRLEFAWSSANFYDDGLPDFGRVWITSSAAGQTLLTMSGNPGPHADPFGMSIATPGDLNGNGVDDIAVTANFPPRLDLRDGASGALLWSLPLPSATFGTPTGLFTIGDINGDGVRDLARSNTTGPVSLVSGANGTLIQTITGFTFLRSIGDVDGDDVEDLAGRRSSGNLAVLSGADRHTLYDIPGSQNVYSAPAAVGDLNADDIPDMAVDLGDSRVLFLSGHDGSGLGGVITLPLPHCYANDRVESAGDFDGDGYTDIVQVSSCDYSNQFYACIVVSGRTGAVLRICRTDDPFTENSSYPTPACMPAPGRDLNGDGTPDLIIYAKRPVSAAHAHDADLALIFYTPLPCPADANYDRVVDFLDLNLLLSQYGQHGAAPHGLDADVNHDTIVDFLDLNIILSAFGSACPQ